MAEIRISLDGSNEAAFERLEEMLKELDKDKSDNSAADKTA